ncbi:MAG: UvrD-helicase domain-containing protein [Chitinophagaceae bacterium]
MKFTTEQHQIFRFVRDGKGHGIIDAVAGAGKTTTIMECARLVADKSSILFCAFNNSIVSEISQRFRILGLTEVTVRTVHSLGRQILIDNNFTGKPWILRDEKYREILENKDTYRNIKPFLKTIFQINGFPASDLGNRSNFAATNLLYRINNRLLEINQKFRATLTSNNPAGIEDLATHFGVFSSAEVRKKYFSEEINAYFKCHEIILENGNLLALQKKIIDYTDMLYLPHEWKLYPSKRYQFLFIDECQDLSKSQFAVASKFGKKDGRIMAVGDPQQSIYGFTGADIHSFERVKEYTKAKQFTLTRCFRCPQSVIQLAQELRPDITGIKPEQGVVSPILFDEVVNTARSGDLIISRLRAPMILLIFNFIDKNIKVKIHDDDVREIINEIRNIFKQEEILIPISSMPGGFERLKLTVKKRWDYIIEKNAARITQHNEREVYVKTEKMFLARKLEFLHKKFIQWDINNACINDLLLKIRDFISATDNPIKLSTIHRAKGLENDRVFILNYDELPYYRQHQKDWERVQEINLKYVAVTRALNELFLIESKRTDVIEENETLFDNLPFYGDDPL